MVQANGRNVLKFLSAGAAVSASGMPYVSRAQDRPYKLGFVEASSGPAEPLGAPR